MLSCHFLLFAVLQILCSLFSCAPQDFLYRRRHFVSLRFFLIFYLGTFVLLVSYIFLKHVCVFEIRLFFTGNFWIVDIFSFFHAPLMYLRFCLFSYLGAIGIFHKCIICMLFFSSAVFDENVEVSSQFRRRRLFQLLLAKL